MTELPMLESFDGLLPPPNENRLTSASDVVADAHVKMHRVSARETADAAPVRAEMDADAIGASVTDAEETDVVARAAEISDGLPPDLAYVGIIGMPLETNWNCSSITLTEPLLGRDRRLFSDLDELVGNERNAGQQTIDEAEEAEQDDVNTEAEADVIERLAEWLIEVRAAASEVDGLVNSDADSETDPDIDGEPSNPGLFRLVEEFTSLRQDVKLQAKSARGMQDQAGLLVDGLNRAIEQFQSVAPREQVAARDAVKPLLESLTDLDTALDRGRLAAETARTRWLNERTDHWQELVDVQLQSVPVWKRWLMNPFSANLADALQTRFSKSWSASQDAQVEGYRLVQNRLRRLLQQNHVERIETVGQLTDPNLMTVVDVADHEGLPAGTVLEELRPGYVWRGQLLRYAEVRVVRSRPET